MTVQKGILVFFIISLSYIIKGLVGFGDSLLTNPLMSVSFPVSVITPSLGMISPVFNTQLVIKNRKRFSAKLVLPIVAFNVLGIIPGVLLLKRFGTNNWMKLGLGLVIVYLGFRMLLAKTDRQEKPKLFVCGVASFLSGVCTGLYGINMLYLAYMERIADSREQFRANTCFVFIVADIIRFCMYLVSGLITKDVLLIAAIGIPAAFIGMWVGSLIDRRINDRVAKKLIHYVFIMGGISTVIYAIIAIVG